MIREVMTVEEIRDVMQVWIGESTALNGTCRECGAPTPVRLTMADVSGCNWTVIGFPNLVPCCSSVVQDVVTRARRTYNLAPREERHPGPRLVVGNGRFYWSRDEESR